MEQREHDLRKSLEYDVPSPRTWSTSTYSLFGDNNGALTLKAAHPSMQEWSISMFDITTYENAPIEGRLSSHISNPTTISPMVLPKHWIQPLSNEYARTWDFHEHILPSNPRPVSISSSLPRSCILHVYPLRILTLFVSRGTLHEYLSTLCIRVSSLTWRLYSRSDRLWRVIAS